MNIFKHSRKDLYLVLVCFVNVCALLMFALLFNSISPVESIVFTILLVAFYCTNYQCVSHNFIHNEFFNSKVLNTLFSAMNSMAMGLPQTLYYHHHMNHHRYNNDVIDPETRTTKDISSLYRYGKNGEVENILSYSFIGFFRIDLVALAKRAKTRLQKRILLIETLSVFFFWAVLIFISAKFFFLFYLPIWYLGQVAALMENYFEHYGATSGDRRRDSVSCYGKLYNLLWFNNGYHQEHHFAPTVHWTQIQEVSEKLPLPSQRVVVKGAHFFNF